MQKSTPSLPQTAARRGERSGPVELDAGLLEHVAGGASANPRSGGWSSNPRSGGWSSNPRSGGWSSNPRSGGW